MNKKNALIVIVLIVACCIAFGRIAGNDFINFDDQGYITENDNIKSGFNVESIKWAFTAIVVSNWHPLTLISHMLDWSLFGANAGGHHLISLILHIASVIFLFLFLNKTTNNFWPSLFAAAFFALHPLRVESVAWAAERKDVLSMFFGTACLLMYAFYVEKQKALHYIACLILFTLGLMSKPMLVTLPFAMMLLDYWPLERWQKALAGNDPKTISITGLVLEKIPFLLLTIISGIITLWAQSNGAVASPDILPFTTRLSNAMVSFIAYLGKIFLPINLAVYYPYNFFIPVYQVLLSGLLLALTTAAVICAIKKMPFLFVGWFWYLGTLIPVIGLVQVGTQAMADRYTYLPSIGIAIVLAWGVPRLINNKRIREKILWTAAAIMLMILAILTWQQCGYWKNSETLFNHTLHVTKDNFVAHGRLASYMEDKGNLNLAIYHYNKAINIKAQPPLSYAGKYLARGSVYDKLAMQEQALTDYNKAVTIKPDFAEGYYARGTFYGKSGQYQLAINDLTKAITLKPDYVDAYNNRGIVLNQMSLFQQAIGDFNKSIQLKPGYANAFNNRAFSYLNLGNIKSGCSDAGKACDLGNCKMLEWAQSKGLCR